MRIRTQCKACGLPFRTTLTPADTQIVCPNCADSHAVDPTVVEPGPPPGVTSCGVCGCEHLYRQRDFNRAWGCGLVALGAALVPWTYGLSLVVLALVDLILYYRLPESVVCYRCDTVYRDARPRPRQTEFDLLKHDVLKYGKAWQEVDVDAPSAH